MRPFRVSFVSLFVITLLNIVVIDNKERSRVAYCCDTTVAQCTVLTELGRGGRLTIAELSRHLDLDKGWMSRAVEVLVQEGLVEKVPDAEDRRMVRLSLSSAGEQRLAALQRTLNGLVTQVMHHIPKAEHEHIQSALALLYGALQTELANPSEQGMLEDETATWFTSGTCN